ncbi:MAG: EAL domain-containing protein [Campylobacterota bacterium]|nr:EAL domain-containing protein [Campylobacterota bacterium]
MAELKELIPFTSKLSLLYIDEDQELLGGIAAVLKKIFYRVDDASDATIGISYAKLNSYDLVIIDSTSSVMSVNQLIKNIKSINQHQNIIISTKDISSQEELEAYQLGISTVIKKPFNASSLLDKILFVASKLLNDRSYLEADMKKLNDDLLYERKRIGRFMLSEKKFSDKIKLYEDNIHINRNIYELTRLPSKYALQTELNGTLQTLLYINIDHFDFINSVYGMGKANKLLKECAKRLNLFLPKNAELFHITADEFVILIDEPSIDQDTLLANQIQALFKEAPLEFDEYSHFLIFSIGIARGEGKKLFINAKSASKESRYFGGDQATIYNASSDYMKEQKENRYWVKVLKKAFDDDRIITFYQPIINHANPSVKHYEVLCRLLDDNGKLVDATKFISSAKLVGLITQISKTVIDKTFKLFKDNDYNFSINISIYDLHEEYLVKFLEYKCQRYGISSDRVYLELVEDIIISKTKMIDKQILDLKDRGFHVVIDDFGPDKFAFSRMFDLKADLIKIDGSFIKELSNSNSSYKVIVKSIVDFAKKSGIKTIAEHVESIEVYEMVKELGIDYSQGYLLGRPSRKLN